MKPNTNKVSCCPCHGTGTTVHIRGGFQMMSTCPTCNTVKCHGEGVQVNRAKTITVDLPHGLQRRRGQDPGQGSYPDIAVEADLKDSVKLARGDILVREFVSTRIATFDKEQVRYLVRQGDSYNHSCTWWYCHYLHCGGTKGQGKGAPGTQYNQVISIP
ncbi:CNT_collapsed_G0015670.mRNA.1.CDS.1 [Saccharomyces cerevisiae]|nr:CNT_collapsed_G0015670.mRNA.1.CDS.1 [Saccharomyces cerevisiae]